jgi:hypothetical protein
VEHTAEVLRRLGGDVTLRLYPGMGHLVHQDEIALSARMGATFKIRFAISIK